MSESGRMRIQNLLYSRLIFLTSALLCAIACGACVRGGKISETAREGPSASERGTQIVAEYLKNDAAPYRQANISLTVLSATEAARTYELKVSRKQTADETLTLTEIEQPLSERNASLTIEHKGQDAVSVTYASALERFREAGTGKMFFGGVTAQEFLGEWDKYNYRLIGEKDLAGVKVYEVEAMLKPGRSSNIARFTVDFRLDNSLPAEMYFFNSAQEKLRHFQVTEYRNFGGRAYIGRVEIENHIYKTKVVVETISIKESDRGDDDIFTREHLKQISRQ